MQCVVHYVVQCAVQCEVKCAVQCSVQWSVQYSLLFCVQCSVQYSVQCSVMRVSNVLAIVLMAGVTRPITGGGDTRNYSVLGGEEGRPSRGINKQLTF